MYCHAGQIGADLGAFTGMRMALGALSFKDQLAGSRVSLLLGQGTQLVEHLLPVWVWQTAAGLQEALSAARNLPVRMTRQRLFLVEGQIGELQFALLQSIQERSSPII